LVTAVVGAWLARQQGWRTWAHIRTELEAGRLPTTALLDAVMIFVAGALLLTPGMLTDLFGFSLLLPPCRRWYRKWLSRWLGQRFRIDTDFPFSASPSAEGDRDRIIDSYVVDRPDDEKPNP